MAWKRRQLAKTTEALRAATVYMFGEPIIPTDGPYAGRLFIGDGVTAGGKVASSSATVLDFKALGTDTAITSAATTDLGSSPTARVLITGTTGITSFGNSQNEFRLIRFASAGLVITPGANLVVPGGQPITTQANDTAILTSDGASPPVWRVRHYQRADGSPLAPYSGSYSAAQQAAIRDNAIPAGFVVDRAYAEYTANASLTATIPADDTIPQNTEGTQILTASITPKSTTNRVRIRFQGDGTSSTGPDALIAALFVGAGVNAVRATYISIDVANFERPLVLEFEHVPGAVTPQTYSIRVGAITGTMRLNGNHTGRLFGGTMAATLVVEELKA